MTTVSAGTTSVTVRALSRERTVSMQRPVVRLLPAGGRSVQIGAVAGPAGPAGSGNGGAGEAAIVIGNTAPIGHSQPWLRIEVDGDGDVQALYLGRPD